MSGPRVGLVCGALRTELDGVADYTAQLAQRLAGRGTELVVLTAGEPEELPGVNVRAIAREWSLPEMWHAGRAIRELAPDVVHLQFAPSAYRFKRIIGLLPSLIRSLPLVVTLHEFGTWPPRLGWLPQRAAPPLWRAIERRGWWERETLRLLPRAEAVLCAGESYANAVLDRLPAKTVAIVPIAPNVPVTSTDRGTARARLRERLGVGNCTPVGVFFGFVHPVKGIPYLLDALTTLRRTHPALRLVIAGGFTSLALPDEQARQYRTEVETAIASRGLDHVVTLTGWRPREEVSQLLHGADFAVLPFTAGVTAKSGALLTVLAHGLPTIATRASGQDAGPKGVMFVPTRDAGALAEAIERLLVDPRLAGRLSQEAEEAAPRDPWDAIVETHMRVYQRVLSPS